MNAVIVDIRKKQAAALDETGRVVRIPNADYEIGQTIVLHKVRPARTPTMLKRLSTGVAAAVLIAVIGMGTVYAMPYGTVTLDGSTSIEYTINCFDYVLDVKGTNEGGEALLADMDIAQLCHHRVDQAVSATMEQLEHWDNPDRTNTPMRISSETRNTEHTHRLQQRLEPIAGSGAPFAEEDRPEAPEEAYGFEPPPAGSEGPDNGEQEKPDVPGSDYDPGQASPKEERDAPASFPGREEAPPSRDFEALPGDPPRDAPPQMPEDPGFAPPPADVPRGDALHDEAGEQQPQRGF